MAPVTPVRLPKSVEALDPSFVRMLPDGFLAWRMDDRSSGASAASFELPGCDDSTKSLRESSGDAGGVVRVGDGDDLGIDEDENWRGELWGEL